MTIDENEEDAVENVRLLYRSRLLGYRFNGFLNANDVFSGEFVFTSLRQGLNMTFVLAPNSYRKIKDVFIDNADSEVGWVYQLVTKTGNETEHRVIGDLVANGGAIGSLNTLTMPLHQLALLQQSVLQPWCSE